MILLSLVLPQQTLGQITDNQLVACSCIKTARYYGSPIPIGTDAEEILPNSVPVVGGLILFKYPKTYHAALIVQFLEYGFWVIEGNKIPCKIGYRFVSYNDPYIVGFTTKDKIELRND